MDRLNGVNIDNMKLASFDVTSLFTDVPIGEALESIKSAVNNR